jgi:hypothetical protein
MASSVKCVQETIESDKRTITCGSISRSAMVRCLRDMRSARIKELTLVDFNHCKSMFFGDRSNYIGRGYSALLNNSHIGVLRLGNEFVKSFIDPDKGICTIKLEELTRLRSLSELSLHNNQWNPVVFEGLQRYLTHE